MLTGASVHAAFIQATFTEVSSNLHSTKCKQLLFSKHKTAFMSHAGGSSDEGKPGGVMVEFDDGDRGKILLPNIRLLPPGYQIQCK